MKLVVALVAQFVLCWTSKPIDYTPLLQYLDDDLVRDLTDPIEGRGQILKDNLEKYNDRMGDCKDMIEQNVYEAYIKAVELQKIGGPQFLKSVIDRELFKKLYNWSEEDFVFLEKQFEITKQIWKELEAGLKPAEAVFKIIHENEAKEKAEMEEKEKERVKKLQQTEVHSKNNTVR